MKTLTEKDLKKPFIANFIFVVVIIISVYVGLNIAAKFNYFENINLTQIFVAILVLLISIIVSFILGIILHEAGHLVFGLLSGYKFHSFQVFNFKLIKSDSNKIQFKISKNMLLGQCILKVDDKKEIKYKSYLYGGSLFNLFFTIIPLVIFVLFKEMNNVIYLPLLIFSCINSLLFYSNGVPLNINGIYNDALNLKLMNKYEFFKDLIINSLKLQNELEVKTSIIDVDYNLINSAKDIDYTIIHKYEFSVSETIRRIVKNEDNQFELILEHHKFRYALPIQYKYSNIIFVLYYYLLNNISYKGILADKKYTKLFKNAKSFDPLLEVCLSIVDYKENKKSKEDVIYFINTKLSELNVKFETLIEKECYVVLFNKAIEYLNNTGVEIHES